MKKMMTAFAACMIAGLVSAQVESANIVGYQTTTAPAGFTVFAPTFTAVGNANPVFSTITGTFSFNDQIQFFDASGNVFFSAAWDDGTINPDVGWYTTDFATSLGTTEIPVGQAFFVYTAGDVAMTASGEVGATNITVNCDAGFTTMGNARPYAITYGDLQVANMAFNDQIQFFDGAGNVSFTAAYDDGTISTPGWYTTDFSTDLATTTIPAGQGFFLYSQSGGATCTIPALY